MLTYEQSPVSARAADTIAAIVNRAFSVEGWFVDGDRTTPADIDVLLQSPPGVFFVARDGETWVGCVYAEQPSPVRGYIGLLAVLPERHGEGIGPRLMNMAEQYLAGLGCHAIDITVVNLRTDLFPFYERRGYGVSGDVVPFPRDAKVPCHLVRMTKTVAR
jgi:GNAT superfamily N-acetyltransferase